MTEIQTNETWMQSRWRPAMGWMYMTVCIFDMILFPIFWAAIQSIQHQQLVQWNPLTLQGGGLFHVAMGAVLGIAAFGRTREKLAGVIHSEVITTPTEESFPSSMSTTSDVSTTVPAEK